MMAWTLFVNPLPVSAANWSLWLLLPLLASVAIVYKTIRATDLRRLPLDVVLLVGYMIAGLVGLGAAIWLIRAIFL